MDIEQIIYEAGRLHDAASLLNRPSRESTPPIYLPRVVVSLSIRKPFADRLAPAARL